MKKTKAETTFFKIERGLKEAITYENGQFETVDDVEVRSFKLPKFWEGRTPPPEYYQPVPLDMTQEEYFEKTGIPSIDLGALSRFCRANNRDATDISYEEMQQFVVKEKNET